MTKFACSQLLANQSVDEMTSNLKLVEYVLSVAESLGIREIIAYSIDAIQQRHRFDLRI